MFSPVTHVLNMGKVNLLIVFDSWVKSIKVLIESIRNGICVNELLEEEKKADTPREKEPCTLHKLENTISI